LADDPTDFFGASSMLRIFVKVRVFTSLILSKTTGKTRKVGDLHEEIPYVVGDNAERWVSYHIFNISKCHPQIIKVIINTLMTKQRRVV